MTSYGDRLLACAQRYKEIQQRHPKKAWGEIDGGHQNIPNTAEVLAILRCARESYSATSVQQGMDYLATRVLIHPRPMGQPGSHWPLTRFLVYGLVGMTQWREWQDDDRRRSHPRLQSAVTVPQAVDYCVEWLDTHQVGDGWPDRADLSACSVLQTATAILALDRIGRLPVKVEAARNLLAKVQNRRSGSWPEVVNSGAYRATGSAPHTALAAIALAGGNRKHQMHSERGRDWLLSNTDRWIRATDPERHEGVEPWVHMTFALGLRACLRTGTDPLAQELRSTIEFLDRLWDPSLSEWRGGQGMRPSVHGSHAVVLAYEELKRAQKRVDPIIFFSAQMSTAPGALGSNMRYALMLGDRSISIIDVTADESPPPIELGEASWKLVCTVAKLQFRGGSASAPVSLAKLRRITQDPRTMVRRINATVEKHTGGRVKKLIHIPRGGSSCELTIPMHANIIGES